MVKKTKIPTFKSVDEAFSYYKKKEQQKLFKKQGKFLLETTKAKPSEYTTGQIFEMHRQAALRRRSLGFMGSRAEQLEIEAVSFDEVPMLHDMERQRSRSCTPPDRSLRRIEKEVTDSFPD